MAGRPDSTVRKRSFAGKAIGGGFAVLGLLGCGLIVRPVVLSVAADMADVVLGVFMLAVTLVGHAVTTWWGLWKRPHGTRWVFTQLPYLVVYVMLYFWYGAGWSIEDGGPPSLWIVPWVGLAGVSLSWVLVWWLDYGERRNAKRAIVFPAMVVVLMAGNGFTAAVMVFRSTDGLGLQGPGTPEAAVSAFTANTCLFTHDWYHRGGKPVAADCPDWSSEPGEGLGRYVTNEQPRQTLERWFEHYRAFEALPRLRYEHPAFDDLGDAVTARLEVELPVQAEGQDLGALTPEQRWCLPEGRDETWSIRLESVLAGGWKVSRLEVQSAVAVVAFRGSACERLATG